MTPRKQPVKPSKTMGLFPKLKRFWEALGDRYQRALQVIDEALASDNLKDKIWAVDLILKKTPASDTTNTKSVNIPDEPEEPILSPGDLEQLSDAELLSKIRVHLKDWGP